MAGVNMQKLRMVPGDATVDIPKKIYLASEAGKVDQLRQNYEPNPSTKGVKTTKSAHKEPKESKIPSSPGRRDKEATAKNVRMPAKSLNSAKSEPNLTAQRSKPVVGSKVDKKNTPNGLVVQDIIQKLETKSRTGPTNNETSASRPRTRETGLKKALSKPELGKQTEERQEDARGLKENVVCLEKKVEGLQKEVSDLKTENQNVQNELSNLKFENQNIPFLQSEVLDLKTENQKVAFLQKEVSILKFENQKIASLKNEVSNLKFENQKMPFLQQEVSNLKITNEKVVEKLQTDSKRIAHLEKAVADLMETRANMQIINPTSQNASQEENKTPVAHKRGVKPPKPNGEKIPRISPKPEETYLGNGHSSRDIIKSSKLLQPKSLYPAEGTVFGIEGQNNSCYMDSSLNSMFLFTNAFHHILENTRNSTMSPRKSKGKHNSLNEKLCKYLREEIAEPLNINKGLKLNLGAMSGFRKLLAYFNFDYYAGHEMDPEEFISTLFGTILKTPGFYRIDGDSEGSYVFQTYADMTKRTAEADVQSLLEYSFSDSKIFLQSIPSPGFIIKMPVTDGRHMFKTIYPNPIIDLKNIIVKANRRNNLEMKMRLSAVICLSGRHFTTFIRETEAVSSPWWYLDSFSCSSAVLHTYMDNILEMRECSQEWPVSGVMKNCYMCFYLPIEST